MSQTNRKRGLGRGLDALFQDAEVQQPSTNTSDAKGDNAALHLPITDLQPGQFQPRHHFDGEALKELSESIRAHGILQPLLVRPISGQPAPYEIIAGERRWRAAQKAQLHSVPVIIQALDDDVALEVALIENLQREDLSAIEEALGYRRLIEEFSYTQEELSKKLGKSRSQVTNTLRLLKLPPKVQALVNDGTISAGHARAILSAKDPLALAKAVVAEGLSVRETEKRASEGEEASSKAKKGSGRINPSKTADLIALEKTVSEQIGMRVKVSAGKDGSGRMVIQYKDLDQLDLLLSKLS